MASLVSSGSPRASRNSTPTARALGQTEKYDKTPTNDLKQQKSMKSTPSPLHSSVFGNRQSSKGDNKSTTAQDGTRADLNGMEDILARLRLNDSRKPSPKAEQNKSTQAEPSALEKLLTSLHGNNQALKKQEMDLKEESESDNPSHEDHSSGSDLFTPATESFDVISRDASQESDTVRVDAAEIEKVKQELAAAKAKISRQEQELAESRNLKHTMDQAMGPPSEADFGTFNDISEQTIGNLQSAFNASARPFTSQADDWSHTGEARFPMPMPSTGPYGGGRGRGTRNNHSAMALPAEFPPGVQSGPMHNTSMEYQYGARPFSTPYSDQMSPTEADFGPVHRTFSGSSNASLGFDGRRTMDHHQQPHPIGFRRGMDNLRSSSTFSDRSNNYGGLSSSMPGAFPGVIPGGMTTMTVPAPYGIQQRHIGPPLSPTGSDYSPSALHPMQPWANTSVGNSQTYVTPLEPMNYRRLLDKSVSCDWKYIVDKIVCSNDQQASIFLQQKLKVGTAEQKFEIVEAIVNQAYPLMINRFGNFLVQRCFEHGTPEQVVAIASAIHGNVLSLSMDPFGCHVIQKAFDSVPENHKADMVRELLRRIPDTVIHRYACHVWQKLFELRWSGEPPQIMLKVNEALRGMWHEVALGETGSLVVQNIFENCVEEEKRPAIEEVIASIDLIAHGQFGNWCIQHLCEHGSPPDKRRVIDHILANSYSYSIDQFASKVVEKCLKIGGSEFLDRYLGVITTAHPDRPRIPLIDIAGDQYGNYLIQWILMNTHHHQREQVAIHIRKHMVSLRGSKFGSRVAMLCCNPASVTRPGPGAIVNPYGAPGQPRGWARYH